MRTSYTHTKSKDEPSKQQIIINMDEVSLEDQKKIDILLGSIRYQVYGHSAEANGN